MKQLCYSLGHVHFSYAKLSWSLCLFCKDPVRQGSGTKAVLSECPLAITIPSQAVN